MKVLWHIYRERGRPKITFSERNAQNNFLQCGMFHQFPFRPPCIGPNAFAGNAPGIHVPPPAALYQHWPYAANGQYPNPYNAGTVFRLRPDVARYTNTLAKKGEKGNQKTSKKSKRAEEKKEKNHDKAEKADSSVNFCSLRALSG